MPEPVPSEHPMEAKPAEAPVEEGPKVSPKMAAYFKALEDDAKECYVIAGQARDMGYDPDTRIEMPLTRDLAERVESLVGPPGIAGTIRELAKKNDRERLAIEIAEIAIEAATHAVVDFAAHAAFISSRRSS